jgi:hypothetical protein
MEDITNEDKEKLADILALHPFLKRDKITPLFFILRYHPKKTTVKKMKFAIKMLQWYGVSISEGREFSIHDATICADPKYKELYSYLKNRLNNLRKQDLKWLKYVVKHGNCCNIWTEFMMLAKWEAEDLESKLMMNYLCHSNYFDQIAEEEASIYSRIIRYKHPLKEDLTKFCTCYYFCESIESYEALEKSEKEPEPQEEAKCLPTSVPRAPPKWTFSITPFYANAEYFLSLRQWAAFNPFLVIWKVKLPTMRISKISNGRILKIYFQPFMHSIISTRMKKMNLLISTNKRPPREMALMKAFKCVFSNKKEDILFASYPIIDFAMLKRLFKTDPDEDQLEDILR